VELARAAADYDAVEQAQRSAFVTLAALLNRPLEGMLPISGKLETMPPPVPLGELTAQALNSNADLLKITQDLRTEERRLALARSQKVPNLALQVGTDLNSPPDFNVGPRGQIGITLPLLYHGQGEIALSSARVELLRLSLEAQRTNASAQVAAAYFDYVSKMRQAQQYGEQIVPQTERLERMAEDSYRSGKSNLLTLIDTQRKLNDVRKAYLDILFAAQSSFAALEESVGVPLD
jgi:outer membrane protein TolC